MKGHKRKACQHCRLDHQNERDCTVMVLTGRYEARKKHRTAGTPGTIATLARLSGIPRPESLPTRPPTPFPPRLADPYVSGLSFEYTKPLPYYSCVHGSSVPFAPNLPHAVPHYPAANATTEPLAFQPVKFAPLPFPPPFAGAQARYVWTGEAWYGPVWTCDIPPPLTAANPTSHPAAMDVSGFSGFSGAGHSAYNYLRPGFQM
ncbi:hypothetical protein BDW59DRAFT_162633 [Aspergillus cavernicola]|uniref:Copper-fist domain-containing protein n=1 Tax=Aspergillus cavernicola TaxID=176166 RepID=A0ABR4I966_9EURO